MQHKEWRTASQHFDRLQTHIETFVWQYLFWTQYMAYIPCLYRMLILSISLLSHQTGQYTQWQKQISTTQTCQKPQRTEIFTQLLSTCTPIHTNQTHIHICTDLCTCSPQIPSLLIKVKQHTICAEKIQCSVSTQNRPCWSQHTKQQQHQSISFLLDSGYINVVITK